MLGENTLDFWNGRAGVSFGYRTMRAYLTQFMMGKLMQSRSVMRLHAGAFYKPEMGAVIIHGPSGGGKSTFSVVAALHGAVYLSHEQTLLEWRSDGVHVLP